MDLSCVSISKNSYMKKFAKIRNYFFFFVTITAKQRSCSLYVTLDFCELFYILQNFLNGSLACKKTRNFCFMWSSSFCDYCETRILIGWKLEAVELIMCFPSFLEWCQILRRLSNIHYQISQIESKIFKKYSKIYLQKYLKYSKPENI